MIPILGEFLELCCERRFLDTLLRTTIDLAPIIAIIFVFQYLIIRRPLPHLQQVLFGFVYVLLGLSLFLVGLNEAMFPLGRAMAQQLTAPEFLGAITDNPSWSVYLWVYAFAACVGFSSTLAEPSLIAVSLKAEEVSAGGLGNGYGLGVTYRRRDGSRHWGRAGDISNCQRRPSLLLHYRELHCCGPPNNPR